MTLSYPIDNQSKGVIEQTKFLELKALKLKGGLPVLTSIPDYDGTDGEIVLVNVGGVRRFYCYIDGTWEEIGQTDNLYSIQTFTDDGTWVCPRGVTQIYVDMVAGGGGGGGTAASGGSYAAGGGGGGAGLKNELINVTPLTGYSITIGAGGVGGTVGSVPGTDGGDTIAFGHTLNGGGGGATDDTGLGGSAGDSTAGAGGDGNQGSADGGDGGVGTGDGNGGSGGAGVVTPLPSAPGGGGGGASGLGGDGGNGGDGKQSATDTPQYGAGGGGAGGSTSGNREGKDGSPGVVIIKIPISSII